jgi:hypothetical protein
VPTIYFDTSTNSAPLTASGQVFNFGVETEFWLTASSNIIVGQSVGPSVQFVIQSKVFGQQTIQVDYATATAPQKVSGNLISVIVPATGGGVSVRLILSDSPIPLTLTIVGSGTTSGSVPAAISGQVILNATPTVIYTCPPLLKTYVIRAAITSPNTGAGTAFLWQALTSTGLINDWITPKAGIAIANNGTAQIGSGGGNDVVIPPDMRPLLPGDVLMGNVTGAATDFTISVELLRSPL